MAQQQQSSGGWAGRKQQYLQFCDETSMHGFADWKRSRLMRWFWVVVIIVFFIIAFLQIYQMFKNYFDDPFVVEMKPLIVPRKDLQIPSVQVCLSNPVWRNATSSLPQAIVSQAMLYRLRSHEALVTSLPELRWRQLVPKVPTMAHRIPVIVNYLSNENMQAEVDDVVVDMVIAYEDYDKVRDILAEGLARSKELSTEMSEAEATELLLRMYAVAIQGWLPCADDEFRCDDGQCIPQRYVCNNEFDCEDRSDEKQGVLDANGQPCYTMCDGTTEFTCDDKRCIPLHQQCDGQTHCDDGSDEDAQFCAESACPQHSFRCGNARCIPMAAYCDGQHDCTDGSDETDGCSVCSAPGARTCKSFRFHNWQMDFDQTCIHSNQVCDGVIDCEQHGMDEYGDQCQYGWYDCPVPVRQCPIPPAWPNDECDAASEFVCQLRYNPAYIPPHVPHAPGWTPFGRQRCANASAHCAADDPTALLFPYECCNTTCFKPQLCNPNEFQCSSPIGNRPLPYSEESGLSNLTVPAWCQYDARGDQASVSERPWYVHYGFGECIDRSLVCDGKADCANGVDEDLNDVTSNRLNSIQDTNAFPRPFCPSRAATTFNDESTRFKCRLDEPRQQQPDFIPAFQVCDGRSNCRLGDDELNCSSCQPTAFACANGRQCVERALYCNGNASDGCDDQSDEPADCQFCDHAATDFKCAQSGRCLPVHRRCNGKVDCSSDNTDASDEMDCDNFEGWSDCATDHVSCAEATGICVSLYQLCDERKDCPDGSDENSLCTQHCQDARVAPRAFACDGRCMARQRRCDYVNDCPVSLNDERNCTRMAKTVASGSVVNVVKTVPTGGNELRSYIAHIGQSARRPLPAHFGNQHYDVINILKHMSLPVEKVFRLCSFLGVPFNCSKYTQKTYSTAHGLCYTVNVNAYNSMNQSMASEGLFVLLDTNADDTYDMPGGSLFFPEYTNGLKVSFTDEHGAAWSPSYRVPERSLAQFILKRTDYDRSVTEASGGCTSAVDTKVRRIVDYTIEACQNECFLQKIVSSAGCAPPIVSDERASGSQTATCRSAAEQRALSRAYVAVVNNHSDAHSQCEDMCLPACKETKVSASVTYEHFPSRALQATVQKLPSMALYQAQQYASVPVELVSDIEQLSRSYEDGQVNLLRAFAADYENNYVILPEPQKLDYVDGSSNAASQCAYKAGLEWQYRGVQPDCQQVSAAIAQRWADRLTALTVYYPDSELTVVSYGRRMAFEDFFGQIGGFLGLWTGASIMSFIHLAVFAAQFAFPQLDPDQNQVQPESAPSELDTQTTGNSDGHSALEDVMPDINSDTQSGKLSMTLPPQVVD